MEPLPMIRTIEHHPLRRAIERNPIRQLPGWLALATRSQDFAETLLARLMARHAGVLRLDFTLRRSHLGNVFTAGDTHQQYAISRSFDVRISPVMHLRPVTMLVQASVDRSEPPRWRDTGYSTSSDIDDGIAAPDDAAPMGKSLVRRLVERSSRVDSTTVITRRVAIESPPDHAIRSRAPSQSQQPVAATIPVGTLVKRPGLVPLTDDQSIHPRQTHATEFPRPVERAVAQKQTPSLTEQVDLDRLTDRVVQAIDRRVTSHRERLGRW